MDDDLIRMAKECGFEVHERKQEVRIGIDALTGVDSTAKLRRFAELIRADERAKLLGASVEAVGDGYTTVVTTGDTGSTISTKRIVVSGVEVFTAEALAARVAQAQAEEREACAKVCQQLEVAIDGGGNAYYRPADARQCATAIRARGGKEQSNVS